MEFEIVETYTTFSQHLDYVSSIQTMRQQNLQIISQTMFMKCHSLITLTTYENMMHMDTAFNGPTASRPGHQ